ncbi:MAG TPA: DUF2298 domain-containing protein, partial [Dehalococcoidia bacterium]|nr:DUF2298 domain-containing protein [Dehalococcoidia bacterium]
MLGEAFAWWFVVEVLGIVALPVAFLLFRRLPGAGYAFAKPLGVLLTGYLFWLALTAHVLPNRPGSVVWCLLAVAAVDFLILRRHGSELVDALRARTGFAIAVEAVFAAAFFTAAHIRSYIPEIFATEKPMDFMFLNAAARSRFYPPEDPWLAGADVSYYYFGYVLQAILAKLAFVKTSVAFNLGLAGTAALAATVAFGLGYELASSLRRVAFRAALTVGVGAAVLVTVLGNLEGVLEFAAANGALPAAAVERIDIGNLEDARKSDACLLPVVCIKYPDEQSSFWWWWRATRISPNADSITEFPFFSFILGDLHPHVMAVPYALVAFGLALSFWRREEGLGLDTWRESPALLPVSAVALGALGFLNAWDLPTFGFVLALLVFARNAFGAGELRFALRDSLGFLLPLGALALLLYAPFYAGFSSQASGLEPVTDGATRPLHSALFWAPLLLVALPLPLVLLGRARPRLAAAELQLAAAVPVAFALLWALLVAFDGNAVTLGDAISARGWNWTTTAFFGAALAICAAALLHAIRAGEDERHLVPALVAIGTGVLLVFGAELFFVQDLFRSRLNSVFKLYYQAWLLLGVGGAMGLWWVADGWRPRAGLAQLAKGAWAGAAALAVAAALLYPLGATLSRTEGLSRPGRTLDGMAFARKTLTD